MDSIKKNNTVSTLRWISQVAGAAKYGILVLILVKMATSAYTVYQPLLLRQIINAATTGDKDGFFRIALIFGGFQLLSIAINALYSRLATHIQLNLDNRFIRRHFSSLMHKDYASVSATHTGEWMNRLISDTRIVSSNATYLLSGILSTIVSLVGSVWAIVWLAPAFLTMLIPVGLVMVAASFLCRRYMKKLYLAIRKADGRMRVFFHERLGSLMIVRAFTQEENSIHIANERMEDLKKATLKENLFAIFCDLGMSGLTSAAYLIAAVYCGSQILNGTMLSGDLLAILTLIGQIQGPFASIAGYIPRFVSMLTSAERLIEIEQTPDDCVDPVSNEQIDDFYENKFTSLGLKNASFTYQPPVKPGEDEAEVPMPIVLSGLDLTIRKGDYVAFTGPSGCGKSTVLKLLMSLYPLDSGERFLESTDGTQSLTAQWRRLYAYVPQGNQLLSGTIRTILTFGDTKKEQQEERMWRALDIACAGDFVRELEKGLDTKLGERGTGLSEGQMQRIAIARAIFSDNPILLLDEATSSLDEATEAQLLQNLRQMTNKTVIIITHRPAALEIADTIVKF